MNGLKGVLLAAIGACVFVPAAAQAASVSPILVPGNPSCTDIQGSEVWTELKRDNPNGAVVLDDGTVEVNATIAPDRKSLSFTAAPGVDAVIVKAGPEANVYLYDPDSTGDTNLVVPPADHAVSHVSFCYGPDAPVKPVITIDKSTSTPTVTAGDIVKFSVTATNGGNGAAQNLVIEDVLPAGPAWSFDGAAPAGCAIGDVLVDGVTRQKVTCTVASLAPAASFTFSVQATTSASVCGTYDNTAIATGSNTGPIAPDSAMVICSATTPNPGGPTPGTSVNPAPAAAAPVEAQQVGGVLPASAAKPGSARLRGPTGCIKTATARVYVTGSQIRSVRFVLDGRTLGTTTKRDKAGRYGVTVRRSAVKIGSHRLTAIVSFTSVSGTKSKTLQLRFSRCGEIKPSRARGFTG